HDGVNEEWISDKTRFVWDGLRRQRLDKPYIRENGKLRPATWPEALAAAATALKGKKVAGLVGDLAPVEAAYGLKQLIEGLDGVVECRVDGAKLPAGNRFGYVGDAAIEDIDDAENIILIGTDPSIEAPVLNARIRKAWLAGAKVARIGPAADLGFDVIHIGEGRDKLAWLADQDHADKADLRGVMIIGQGALTGPDGAAVLATALKTAQAGASKVMILHTAAARVGAMDAGATCDGGIDEALGAEVIYNLGADEIDIPAGPTVIYQGSHGDRGAHRADIILPGAAYTEEAGLFVNTEGRPQLALRAGFPPGEAKENWAILRALSGELETPLPFDSLAQLRGKLIADVPHLGRIDEITENEVVIPDATVQMGDGPFVSGVSDFYLTNPIARASQLMAELSANAKARAAAPMAAE
ncbi:MAG: molybdopterin-dependent oxidoreductase, partial [Pseudomonadota bacterium]